MGCAKWHCIQQHYKARMDIVPADGLVIQTRIYYPNFLIVATRYYFRLANNWHISAAVETLPKAVCISSRSVQSILAWAYRCFQEDFQNLHLKNHIYYLLAASVLMEPKSPATPELYGELIFGMTVR